MKVGICEQEVVVEETCVDSGVEVATYEEEVVVEETRTSKVSVAETCVD